MHRDLQKYFKNKKILITGHTGFIGAWLCIILKLYNSKVYGVSLEVKNTSLFEKANIKQRIEKHYLFDIKNKIKLKKLISEIRPEIIIHLAAQSLVLEGYKNPYKTFDNNINSTINILSSFTESKYSKKILITTTDKVYKTQNKKIHKEKDELWGFDPYSSSKVCVEQIVDSYRNLYNDKNKKIFLIARSGNVIGGGDISNHRIVPDIIRSIKKKSVLSIRNPNSIRPWQHVIEPIFGYLHLLRNKKIQNDFNWNFGPDKKNFKRVIDIVDFFKKNFNFKYKVKKNNKKETSILKIDSSKSKKLLSWKTKLDLESTLEYIFLYEKALKNKSDIYNFCIQQIKNYIKI